MSLVKHQWVSVELEELREAGFNNLLVRYLLTPDFHLSHEDFAHTAREVDSPMLVFTHDFEALRPESATAANLADDVVFVLEQAAEFHIFFQ